MASRLAPATPPARSIPDVLQEALRIKKSCHGQLFGRNRSTALALNHNSFFVATRSGMLRAMPM
jgi:hypothetical protein